MVAPIEWPDTVRRPQFFRMSPVGRPARSESVLTGSVEVARRYVKWQAVCVWNHLKWSEGNAIISLLIAGRDGENTYNFIDYATPAKVGTKAGSVTFAADADAGSTSISIAGGTGSFIAGDRFYINQSVTGGLRKWLHEVTSGEDVLGAGNIEVWPPIRTPKVTGNGIDHLGNRPDVRDHMEIVGDLELPRLRPAKQPGENTGSVWEPFSVTLQTAVRTAT